MYHQVLLTTIDDIQLMHVLDPQALRHVLEPLLVSLHADTRVTCAWQMQQNAMLSCLTFSMALLKVGQWWDVQCSSHANHIACESKLMCVNSPLLSLQLSEPLCVTHPILLEYEHCKEV